MGMAAENSWTKEALLREKKETLALSMDSNGDTLELSMRTSTLTIQGKELIR
jgi:hypothetical protein